MHMCDITHFSVCAYAGLGVGEVLLDLRVTVVWCRARWGRRMNCLSALCMEERWKGILETLTSPTPLACCYCPPLQGLMFGYATDETEELMPLTVVLSHGLNHKIAALRRDGGLAWARPDSKTQVRLCVL